MDYFIDDMLNSSRRGSTKSLPSSPGPSEPPLPPFPTPTRKKKNKSVKFPECTSSGMAESSKMPEASSAAAVPLPDTPAPPTVDLPADGAVKEDGLLSPISVATTAAPTQSDYFSATELPPSQSTLAVPRVPGASDTGAPAFFTPASELPLPIPELSHPAKEPIQPGDDLQHLAEDPSAAMETEPATATEEQDASSHLQGDLGAAKGVSEDRVESPPSVLRISHSPIPIIHSQPAILIGISGVPSSGKTTLAHLLSVILPPTTSCFILHQDDFSNPKHLLVPNVNGEFEYDSRSAINFSAFKRVLEYAKHERRLPPGFLSQQPQDERERALSQVPSAVLEELQDSLLHLPSLQDGQPIGIIEGSSLYRSETVRSLLDIKLFLRARRAISGTRCFEHSVKQSSDSGREYWDFRNSFDRNVWRNLTREHEVLFENGDVEARPNLRTCEGVGIAVQSDLDLSLNETLQWVVDKVKSGCEEVAYSRDGEIRSILERKVEYEFCDCKEGLLGKIRQTIFDIL